MVLSPPAQLREALPQDAFARLPEKVPQASPLRERQQQEPHRGAASLSLVVPSLRKPQAGPPREQPGAAEPLRALRLQRQPALQA
jgi:hypothetical protein